MAACFHRLHIAVFCRNRSKTIAGTINSIGKSGGTRCVTFWYTGPSFGTAGNNGRIHTKERWIAIHIAVMIVAAQRFFETHATVAIQIGATIIMTK